MINEQPVNTSPAMDLEKYATQYAELEEEWDVVYRMNIEYRLKAMQPFFRPGNALELGTGGGHCASAARAAFRFARQRRGVCRTHRTSPPPGAPEESLASRRVLRRLRAPA